MEFRSFTWFQLHHRLGGGGQAPAGAPVQGIAGVVEGYALALRRFDRMLARFGVRRLQTTGRPFDSRTMHAMEVRRIEQAGDGEVVEELLGGFTRDGDMLRLAEVAVNRLHPQE